MKSIAASIFLLVIIGQVMGNESDRSYRVLTEEVSFLSRGAKISGSLVLPVLNTPCPAILMIHGSGKAIRNIPYAKKLAERGIAVLTYDKRGCGKSEGTYEGIFNVSDKNINLLADDALAGLSILTMDIRIDISRIGLWGISQAGWIAPVVLSKTAVVAFVVMLSGPTVTVRQEMKYSMLEAKDPNYLNTRTQDEIMRDISKWRFSDILFAAADFNMDPEKLLLPIEIPYLWLYGDKDESIPAYQCIERLKKYGKSNFIIKRYPTYGHLLKEDGDDFFPSERVNTDIMDWILAL